MYVPLLDLSVEDDYIKNEISNDLTNIMNSGRLLKGPYLSAFQTRFAEYIGSTYAVGVASGTDALILGMLALGIGSGDEVILQDNAFAADLEAIYHVGATPILVDVDRVSCGPNVEEVISKITKRTKAILVVHMHGIPADIYTWVSSNASYHIEPVTCLREIADNHKLFLIEDCSHAHGGCYFNNSNNKPIQKLGSVGDIGCFSCGPIKNLGCYGDGGVITVNNVESSSFADFVALKIKQLQHHGQSAKNEHTLLGYNSRLDEFQAAVLIRKLTKLSYNNLKRKVVAQWYYHYFLKHRIPISFVGNDHIKYNSLSNTNYDSVYHHFVILAEQRDKLVSYLKEHDVHTGVHYPNPLHTMPMYKTRNNNTEITNEFAITDHMSERILSLPMWPTIPREKVKYVVNTIVKFYTGEE